MCVYNVYVILVVVAAWHSSRLAGYVSSEFPKYLMGQRLVLFKSLHRLRYTMLFVFSTSWSLYMFPTLCNSIIINN